MYITTTTSVIECKTAKRMSYQFLVLFKFSSVTCFLRWCRGPRSVIYPCCLGVITLRLRLSSWVWVSVINSLLTGSLTSGRAGGKQQVLHSPIDGCCQEHSAFSLETVLTNGRATLSLRVARQSLTASRSALLNNLLASCYGWCWMRRLSYLPGKLLRFQVFLNGVQQTNSLKYRRTIYGLDVEKGN